MAISIQTLSRTKQLNTKEHDIPLAINLEGALVRTDLLVESLCVLLKTKPLTALLVPFWLLKGKAWLKAQIAKHTHLSPRRLPVNPELMAYLDSIRGQREIVLATASNEKFASPICQHFGFDSFIASTDSVNLQGENKLKKLEDLYGKQGFDYAGDSATDTSIWQSARKCILVNSDGRARRRNWPSQKFDKVFDHSSSSVIDYFKGMRVYQWIKNLLIFVPLLVAHKFDSSEALFHTVLAFFAFSLCASSVYILNDLFDLPDDRLHPNKKNRPIASGRLPIKHALFMIPLLLIAAFSIALILPWQLGAVLAIYYTLTLFYSLYLKSVALLDVQILATFYTLRLIAGAAVIEVTPSFWLLAFSMSIFLSLAIAKRYTGLLVRQNAGQKPASRRGYEISDLPILQSFGIASGYISVLILALYVNSIETLQLYSHPMILWLLCPTVLYWIGRLWVYVHRGRMHDDPLIFALTDRTSIVIVIIMVLTTYAAI